MDKAVDGIILDYVQEVKKQYPIKLAYLYGSHARGTANDYSDIDVAFIVDPMDEGNYYALFGDLYNIAAKFAPNIEPNLLVDDGDYCRFGFLAEVVETGRLLDA